ncbi:MAG: hypothetical protein EAX95_06195 [Candidatus Thorarchaeota archaeon]|nr:hypothetical protein [Candidatus Thorarchaeota archaeon]
MRLVITSSISLCSFKARGKKNTLAEKAKILSDWIGRICKVDKLTRFLDREIRESILAEIRPTREEVQKQKEAVSRITESLSDFTDCQWEYLYIQAEGSTGKKQTQLRGASDLDIFVVLSPSDYPEVRVGGQKARRAAVDEIMEGLVDSWFIPALKGLEPDNMQKTYSQHPYLSAKMDGFDVDIVGCFEVSAQELSASGPISAMDRTIHHSEYVNLHLEDQSRDDVRILKSFARASHAYGDTCAVGRMGFTGYALEILIIQNGSLQRALNAIVNLDTTPSDPEGRPLSILKEKATFRDDYVFIIDPTDSNRNVASSFDERAVKLLKLLAKSLLHEVEEGNANRVREMIIEKPIQAHEIPRSIMEHSIVFEFEAEKTYHYTVLRDKLYSLGKLVAGQLQKEPTGESRFGPAIFEVYFEGNLYSLAFLLGRMRAPNTYLSKGPPLSLVNAVEEFKRAHSGTIEKEEHIWTTRTRVHTTAIELAESLIAQHGIKGLGRKKPEETSRKLLRIIHDYVLPVEEEFPMVKGRELV